MNDSFRPEAVIQGYLLNWVHLEFKRNQPQEPMIREIALAEIGTVPKKPSARTFAKPNFRLK